MKREFTVLVNDHVDGVYEGFDANPEGAAYKLLPAGRIESVEGAFYADEQDLPVALKELARYELEVYDRKDSPIAVTKL